MPAKDRNPPAIEWPTLLLLCLTYLIWALGTSVLYEHWPVIAVIVTGVAIAQFSSLQHEALHGHPFRQAWLNEVLVFPALTLTVPYGRFRDTHLAHHRDPILTDPYDDPESNYYDPAVWEGLSPLAQMILRANNTLVGRLVLGPLIGCFLWLKSEVALLAKGDPAARRDWLLHLFGVVLVLIWVVPAAMPVWGYLAAAYLGHALLKIRTFLEHRAHLLARARTVIIEDRGPLSLLFLNNNLHAVHHCHPAAPWYHLPAIYAANRAHYQARNEGYVYRSYAQIFRSYLFSSKDPVPHPLMQAKAAPESDRIVC